MKKGSSSNTRRKFIKQATIIAAAPALMSNKKTKPQVVHHVFFWLKNPQSKQDEQQLIEGLKTLKSIPQIKKLLIGTPAATEKRAVVDNSYQVSELIYFDNVADQNAYQTHPVHDAFVKRCSALWSKVVVYDMMVAINAK